MKLLLALALCLPAAAAKDDAVVGIGIEIKITSGYPVVVSLIPGGPAAKEGSLRPGDRIEAIAQGDDSWQETRGLTLEGAVAKIRGPKGSKVSLRATRAAANGERVPVVVELKRAALKAAPKK